MEDVYIGLFRPSTIPPEITEFIIVVTILDVDIVLKRPATVSLVMVKFISLVLMVEVSIGLKRPSTIPLSIVDQELILTGEVDIGLTPATIPPIT